MKTKKLIPAAALIVMIMAIWPLLFYFPPKRLPVYPNIFVLLTGIGMLISTFGLISYILMVAWIHLLKANNTDEFKKAELEVNFRRFSMEQQMADAEKRRQHDLFLSRNKAIADLLEAAKTKQEDTKEPVFPEKKAGSENKQVFYKETHIENKADKEAFLLAFEEYIKLISIQ